MRQRSLYDREGASIRVGGLGGLQGASREFETGPVRAREERAAPTCRAIHPKCDASAFVRARRVCYAVRMGRRKWTRVVAWLGICGGLVAASACTKKGCPEGAIYIPPGTFTMGSSTEGKEDDVPDPHKVTLTRGFCIDRTEVTRKSYRECELAKKCLRRGMSITDPEGPMEPRDFVDWQEAVQLCRFRGGRLPTDAEWEYAARGPDGRLYPWGNEPPTEEHWAVIPGTSCSICAYEVGTHPKGRSYFGLEDMSGNLSEWVADQCGAIDAIPRTDPTGPSRPQPGCHVVRGSSWDSFEAVRAEASARRYNDDDLGGERVIGFRCAYEPH
jgi:formylglycine-generating enzyme required for sulfatase activity